jgi:hypothetical protein
MLTLFCSERRCSIIFALAVSPMSKEGDRAKKIIHFYCYKCRAYELKTSPHYRAQKQRFARRCKAERAHAEPTQ